MTEASPVATEPEIYWLTPKNRWIFGILENAWSDDTSPHRALNSACSVVVINVSLGPLSRHVTNDVHPRFVPHSDGAIVAGDSLSIDTWKQVAHTV